MALKIAVYGYDTDIGKLVFETMEEQKLKVDDLFPLSPLSGEFDAVTLNGENYMVKAADEFDFGSCDLALFLTTPDESSRLAHAAAAKGCTVIDASGLYSDDERIPLVIPEINPYDIKGVAETRIAIPACATATLLALCLQPIADSFGLERVSATVMESVSGQGRLGTETLARETARLLNGLDGDHEGFEAQVAFNLHTRIGKEGCNGYSEHENTVLAQLGRVLGAIPGGFDVTAVQVPVFYGHTASVHVDLSRSATADEFKAALSECPWIKLPSGDRMLTPVTDAVSERSVLCSRIRRHGKSGKAWSFICMMDNTRRGEAVSVVEIAKLLEKQRNEHA